MTMSTNVICSGELPLEFHFIFRSMVVIRVFFLTQQGRLLREYFMPGNLNLERMRCPIGEL